jgi:thiamine pyrophosphate-dependent acetolactate synthase large subunit-like protein
MNKTEAIQAVLRATAEEPIIFTTGYSCRIARGLADRANHFYMTGSMGLASSIGIGVALETRRTTVVVDGDGALLMNPVGLVTAGALTELRLVHVLLDDGRYASTGGQAVPSTRTDLCAWATASGYPRVHSTGDLAEFTQLVTEEIAACASPVFLRGVLTTPDPPVAARIDADLGDHARRFQAHLAGA